MRKVSPERKAFVEAAGVCMACLSEFVCDCHEIARGPAREAALSEPTLWLALCRSCHEEMDDMKKWPLARQLALRVLADMNANMALLNRVRGRAPTAVTAIEVMKEVYSLWGKP